MMKTSRSHVGLLLVLSACRGSTPSLQVEGAESAVAPESSPPTQEPAEAVDAALTATPAPHAPARTPCNLSIAPWELALARAQYARDPVAWHPEAEPLVWDPSKPHDEGERAALAVDAIPPSDPRFAEAHCRMALVNQHAAAETHFLLAIAALRASAPEGPARYRSLERPSTHIDTTQGSPGRRTRIDLQILGNGFEAEDCRFPDPAL